MGMFQFIGDIAYFIAIVGINVMLFFLLWLTKWRKDSVSIAITVFFGVVALILDLSATMLFIDSVRDFIRSTIRTPLYIILAASIWTLVVVSFSSAAKGRNRRRKKLEMELTPPQEQ